MYLSEFCLSVGFNYKAPVSIDVSLMAVLQRNIMDALRNSLDGSTRNYKDRLCL